MSTLRDARQALFDDPLVTLEGTVRRVVYTSAAWTVLSLTTPTATLTCVGKLDDANEGDILRGSFRETQHERFGKQYEAVEVEVEQASPTTAGLIPFLAHRITGIGLAKAQTLVDAFGDATLDALSDPERLRTVKGIGAGTAASIAQEWEGARDDYASLRRLYGLGMSPYQVGLCWSFFKEDAFATLNENLYAMANVPGLGFKTADALALKRGYARDDDRRLKAACVYAMSEAAGEGHSALDAKLLIATMERTTGVARSEADAGIRMALAESMIVVPVDGLAALPHLADAERDIIRYTMHTRAQPGLTIERAASPIDLSALQQSIYPALRDARLLTLTGAAGTGKTTVVADLVASALRAKIDIALCAPTGKAAQRIAELAQHPASTIHRLLGWNPVRRMPEYHERNPLPYRFVVVDESSMIDIFVLRRLMRAMHRDSSLLLVGDARQLPPVGPGQPLLDLRAPRVDLTEIFRQARDNPIIMGAHAINDGRVPHFEDDERLRLLRHDDPEAIVASLPAYLSDLASRSDGQLPQVISPMNEGPIGIHALNDLVKALVNPGRPGRGVRVRRNTEVHEGDVLMQTKNNYTVGMMNGEQGVVRSLRRGKRPEIVLSTALGDITLTGNETKTLQLAYAVTAHKVQGNQYDSCLLIAHTSHYIMLTKQLLYTMLTRAKERCWIVGSMKALAIGTNNDAAQRSTLMGSDLAWRDDTEAFTL